MMVNVDKRLALGKERTSLAETFETGAIRGDDTIELHAPLGHLHDASSIQKPIFLGHGVLVPTDHLLPLPTQGERQAELRANTIAIRPHMADDTNSLAGAQDVENLS